MHGNETVVDEVDVADLVSEREHDYRFPHPAAGYVEARIVPDPRHARREIFDAGRRIPGGRSETFRVKLPTDMPVRLLARTVADHPIHVAVAMDGEQVGILEFFIADRWQEASVEIPRAKIRPSVEVRLTPTAGSDWTNYHVWLVGSQ
jgi:hypothetical protein